MTRECIQQQQQQQQKQQQQGQTPAHICRKMRKIRETNLHR